MIRFLALTFALTGPVSAADGVLIAIRDHADHARPTFVLDRCDDLVSAVTIYGQILAWNPVYGRDAGRKEPFAWAVTVGDNIRGLRGVFPRLHPSQVQAYMDTFGPVTVRTLVPNLALYQADTETCLTRFGDQDEQ